MVQGPHGDNLDESTTGQTDLPIRRPIFRAKIRQRYLQDQARIELPPLISVRTFAVLWILALLLLMVGALIAFWPLI